MKLPIVEAMQVTPLHQVKPLTPHLSVNLSFSDSPAAMAMSGKAYQFRAEAKFTVDQWSSEERALPHLREQSIRILMHEVYGPVYERLFTILTLLYEAGPIYDDKIAREVETLLNDMSPFK